MNESKKRIEWIDIARAFAIICVVFNHSIEVTYDYAIADVMRGYSIASKLFAYMGYTLGRVGVPFFLMISGALLLTRDWNKDNCIRFWKKNWLRLLICTEIWWIIYDIFIFFWGEAPITIQDVVKNILFIKPVDFPHVWYMNRILGLYILIPFVAMVLNKIDLKLLIFPIVIYFFYSFVVPVLSLISKVAGGEAFVSELSLGFSGGTYGLYLVMGFLLVKLDLDRIKNIWLILTSSIFFVLTVGLEIWCVMNGYGYKLWYDNGLLFGISIPLFILISRINGLPKIFKCFWQSVAKHSFGIYLLHELVLWIVMKLVSEDVFSHAVCTIIRFAITLPASWVAVIIISKIPKVGKLLLNER